MSKIKFVVASVFLMSFSAFASDEVVLKTGRDSWRCATEYLSKVNVVGATKREASLSCSSLKTAVDFVKNRLGREAVPDHEIRFERRVMVPVSPALTALGAKPFRVVGMFDRSANVLTMTRHSAKWLRTRPYFGVGFDDVMYESVLVHENVHALNKKLYEYAPETFAQDEYLAYVAQLWTLPDGKRSEILRIHREDVPVGFSSGEGAINDLVHGTAPHRFGVKSYMHFLSAEGGAGFAARIYSGDFRPPVFED